MVELGTGGLELLRQLECFFFNMIGVALVVDKGSGDVEEETVGVVELVHAGSDFADGVWEGGLFDGEILVGVDDSDDRFGVALDVEHNRVVENVLVCEILLRIQSVDHFLLLFPILLYRDRAFDLILPPNHCVVFAVVYLEFLSGRRWGD